MPRIISFAETTPALLAGVKTVTRRDWQPQYAARWKAGDEAIAYSKNPRAGGKPVARIRLTTAPYLEYANAVPDADYDNEGFEYMSAHGLTLFGGASPEEVWQSWILAEMSYRLWVVRFELIEVITDGGSESTAPDGGQSA